MSATNVQKELVVGSIGARSGVEVIEPPRPLSRSAPVQNTNVLQILEESLPAEHAAVELRLRRLEDDTKAALLYRDILRELARVAQVSLC
jgi:hypothetical protein